MTDHVTLEFTVEPFVPTEPGPHVLASIETARRRGLDVDVGPFGTTAAGTAEDIADAAKAVITAALANGATRISLQISTQPTEPEDQP